jgi:hypothetical protein
MAGFECRQFRGGVRRNVHSLAIDKIVLCPDAPDRTRCNISDNLDYLTRIGVIIYVNEILIILVQRFT